MVKYMINLIIGLIIFTLGIYMFKKGFCLVFLLNFNEMPVIKFNDIWLFEIFFNLNTIKLSSFLSKEFSLWYIYNISSQNPELVFFELKEILIFYSDIYCKNPINYESFTKNNIVYIKDIIYIPGNNKINSDNSILVESLPKTIVQTNFEKRYHLNGTKIFTEDFLVNNNKRNTLFWPDAKNRHLFSSHDYFLLFNKVKFYFDINYTDDNVALDDQLEFFINWNSFDSFENENLYRTLWFRIPKNTEYIIMYCNNEYICLSYKEFFQILELINTTK